MFDNWTRRFDPVRIGSCVLWVDASKIRQGQGASVSSWANLAVPTNTPVTGGGGTAPLFQAAGTYNRPSVRFDGADSVLITPSAVLTDDEFTIFIVCRGNPTTTGDVVISQHDGTATAGRWTVGNGAGNGALMRFFYNDGTASRAIESTVTAFDNVKPYLLRVRSDGAGVSALRVNGGGGSSTSQIAWTPQNTGMRIGGLAGQGASPVNDMPVDVHEIVIFSKALGAQQIQIVERYLTIKWGVL